jgi:hypothetical protein
MLFLGLLLVKKVLKDQENLHLMQRKLQLMLPLLKL